MSNSLLPFSKVFDKRTEEANNEKALEKERENFNIADPFWIITIAHLAVLIICGILNWQLFTGASAGVLGVVIGTVALICETLSFVSWVSIHRSAGRFRKALITVAIVLTFTAIGHAAIEWWKNTNVLESVAPQIQFYAKYLALPALLIEIVGASFALSLTHWRSEVNKERAESEEVMQISRARLIAAKAQMRDESILDKSKLTHIQEQIALQNEYVDRIDELAIVHKRAEEKLNQIPDPKLRDQIRRAWGDIASITSETEDQGKD